MKKLALTLLLGMGAINASHLTDSGPKETTPVSASSAASDRWTQADINEITNIFRRETLTEFVEIFKNRYYLADFKTRTTAGQAAYAEALANDSMINAIANKKMPSDRGALIQYVASGMTEYTVVGTHTYLQHAIAGITGNTTIKRLMFTAYLMPSDIKAVIAAASTMPALEELKLIDIRSFEASGNPADDVVKAIAEARSKGELSTLTGLVLDRKLFPDNSLQSISARIPGVKVRLSIDEDYDYAPRDPAVAALLASLNKR